MNQTIDIVFTPYDLADQYNRHVGVAITSILENCSVSTNIHIILNRYQNKGSSEYQANKERYLEFEEKYNTKIFFHDVCIPDCFQSFRGSKILNVSTYCRLFIPEVLSNVSKALYLDGDVIITSDLKDILDVNIEDSPLAARIDPIFQKEMGKHPHKFISVYRKFTFSKEDLKHYFNAGILYMNLDKIRSELDLAKESEKFLKMYPTVPRADQDALNYFFRGLYKELPSEYNLIPYETHDASTKACIHYAIQKPWNSYNQPLDKQYWNYFYKSPWCNMDIDVLIDNMVKIGNTTFDGVKKSLSGYRFFELPRVFFENARDRVKKYLKTHV